jgi:hypothetical protein
MIGIIIGILAVIAWMASVLFAMHRFELEGFLDPLGLVATTLVVVGLAWVIKQGIDDEARHPCVEHELRMTYIAATKTMMPLRVCIERGEWVE